MSDLKAFEEDLNAAESSWGDSPPDVTHEEPPPTSLKVRAHNYFGDELAAYNAIAKRAEELGVVGGTTVTTENYGNAKIMVGLCRNARGRIEKHRKAGVADALEWQRLVNSKARELTTAIETYEEPLKAGVKAIDDEKERVKREKLEAEECARVEAARLVAEAEAAARKAEQDAIAEANRIETERLAKERAEFLAEQAKAKAEADRVVFEAKQEQLRISILRKAEDAERQRERAEMERMVAAEKAKLEAERKAHEEAQQAFQTMRENAERAESDRLAKIAADEASAKQEAERKERERIDAENAERERVERERIAAENAERLRPDAEKIRKYARAIHKVIDAAPAVASDEASEFLLGIVSGLASLANAANGFGK